MLCTSTTFLFLTSVFNSTLYITKPTEANQCYIALIYDGSLLNDTWPSQWREMKTESTNYCKIPLRQDWDGILIYHKVRYIFPNRSQFLFRDDWTTTLYNDKQLMSYIRNHEMLFYDFIIISFFLGLAISLCIFLICYLKSHFFIRSK